MGQTPKFPAFPHESLPRWDKDLAKVEDNPGEGCSRVNLHQGRRQRIINYFIRLTNYEQDGIMFSRDGSRVIDLLVIRRNSVSQPRLSPQSSALPTSTSLKYLRMREAGLT